jgi:hypothetical protein
MILVCARHMICFSECIQQLLDRHMMIFPNYKSIDDSKTMMVSMVDNLLITINNWLVTLMLSL